MPTPTSREAVLASLLALLENCRGCVLVTVEAGERGGATFRFPPLQTAATDEQLTECERDIIDLIREAGKRLTQAQVKAQLEAAGKIHGDSTVTHALAELTGDKRRLTSKRDEKGRGYGLAEWG
jgi:hypothetical protein